MAFLRWLETTPLSKYMSESLWAFNAFIMLHLVSIAVVVGMIAVIDLRLLGLTSRSWSFSAMSREVLPWTWGAFVVAAGTGVLLFATNPVKYFGNEAFRWKFAWMAIAAVNMLIFQLITYRGVSRWDRDAAVPFSGKLAGGISLVAWIVVVAYGRWTGYTMF
jgi:Family of unknown function (DUF6644)